MPGAEPTKRDGGTLPSTGTRKMSDALEPDS